MRHRAIVLAWILTSACTSAAEDRVYVENHLISSWPVRMLAQVTFQDPDGAMLEAHHVTDPVPLDTVYALMPDGGSVTVFADRSGSPSFTVLLRRSVDGVKPGDRLVFGGDSVPGTFPDCSRRNITGWTVDPATNAATWEDPEAASVDARITRRQTADCARTPFPGFHCESTVSVDGNSATSMSQGNLVTAIEVVTCATKSYDDIRVSLASGL